MGARQRHHHPHAPAHPRSSTRGALDKVLTYSCGWDHKSGYGFNDDLARTFGRRVFAFPLPGVSCTAREAQRHLADLAGALNVV